MMLGRTAANLFWLARYVERAENVARLLEAGYRMSLTAHREGGSSEHLHSMMQAAEVDEAFALKYKQADIGTVSHFMLFDPENLSSVYSCLLAARTNARSVRTALTRDVWETLNSAWLEFSPINPHEITGSRLLNLLQWIKQVSNQFRGALLGTILRDDGFAFSQAGIYVERADNTARILDMKYYVLLPRADLVGGDLDIQQWTLILRAASAQRSYRHVYHDRYRARNIADFLILRPEMPRSLAYCASNLDQTVSMLDGLYGETRSCHETVRELCAMVENTDMEVIFRNGLHEFITEFIARNNTVAERLSDCYNFY
jgi:uncharacterized alpha-E superfamily protein